MLIGAVSTRNKITVVLICIGTFLLLWYDSIGGTWRSMTGIFGTVA